MYIDFDEYPPYSDTISEIFESNFNVNIQCENDYDHSLRIKKVCTWSNEEILGNAEKMFSWCKEKKDHKQQYVKNVHMLNNIEIKLLRNFDSPPDNEHTFSAPYFHEKPIVDVENIE